MLFDFLSWTFNKSYRLNTCSIANSLQNHYNHYIYKTFSSSARSEAVLSHYCPHSRSALISVTPRAEWCFIRGEYPAKPYYTGIFTAVLVRMFDPKNWQLCFRNDTTTKKDENKKHTWNSNSNIHRKLCTMIWIIN